AQPPLYQMTRGKKSEYVLNEKKMRATLSSLGLDGTKVVVFDEHDRSQTREIAGPELRRLFNALEAMEDVSTIVERRGLRFTDLLGQRHHDPSGAGRLPRIHLHVSGEPTNGQAAILGHHFFW